MALRNLIESTISRARSLTGLPAERAAELQDALDVANDLAAAIKEELDRETASAEEIEETREDLSLLNDRQLLLRFNAVTAEISARGLDIPDTGREPGRRTR